MWCLQAESGLPHSQIAVIQLELDGLYAFKNGCGIGRSAAAYFSLAEHVLQLCALAPSLLDGIYQQACQDRVLANFARKRNAIHLSLLHKKS